MSRLSLWLLMSGLILSGCFHDGFREARDAGASGPHSEGDQPGAAGQGSLADSGTADAGTADAGPSRRDAGSPDAEVRDSGVAEAELTDSIELDCVESMRCNDQYPSVLENCISSTTESLTSAGPETRQRFLELVRLCRDLRDCDYVSCAQNAP